MSNLETYNIVPEAERALHAQSASSSSDPQKRRELKIKQYQKEKEIKTRIQVYTTHHNPGVDLTSTQEVRKRRNHGVAVNDPSSDFELIASLLPDPSAKPIEDDEEDTDAEDVLREATLLLLRLTYGQAQAQLQSLEQEIQILRSAPPRPSEAPEDPRHAREREANDVWRLDAPMPQGGPDGKGPLLDSSGKVRLAMPYAHTTTC